MAKVTLTQVQALTLAISALNGEEITETTTAELTEKLTTMRDTLANKSHSKVSEKVLAQRSALSDIILETLTIANKPVTVSELQRLTPELQTFENGEIISGQRITSILKNLVVAGKVENTKDKKKSFFSLVK